MGQQDSMLAAVSNDSLPRELFVAVKSDSIRTEPFCSVMKEIADISRATNWVLDYGTMAPTRQFEYPFAYLATDLTAGLRVLDAGCSIDPFVPFLTRKGLNSVGIDMFSSHDVPWDPVFGVNGQYRGQEKVNRYTGYVRETLGLDLEYEAADMASTTFDRRTFDRIFCISVLEHIPHYKVLYILDEWRRLLKNDGLVVLTVDYAVNGKTNFDIGRLLAESGYLLQGKVNVFTETPRLKDLKDKADSVVVAGFVMSPGSHNSASLLSRLYRRVSLLRWSVDKSHSLVQRAAIELRVLLTGWRMRESG